MRIKIICLLILFSTTWGCKKRTTKDIADPGTAVPTDYPIANGTFIQDFLVKDWDDAKWQQELAVLKEVKMTYVVLFATVTQDQAVYQSNIVGLKRKYEKDVLDMCLRNAEKAGIKVFIGLNFDEAWWSPYTEPWLYDQMELGNKIATEIKEKYAGKYKNAFYGWYWVWEIDNLNYKTRMKQDMLVQALNTNIDHLHTITPQMPVMICPFMNYRVGTAAENANMWTYLFSKVNFKSGDIFAPQDGVGADGIKIELLDSWFSPLAKAVKTRPGLVFWSDAETFVQSNWSSAPLDRFVQQMKIVQPYVSGIMTFAYSHYYSPVTVKGEYHKAYKKYVETGKL